MAFSIKNIFVALLLGLSLTGLKAQGLTTKVAEDGSLEWNAPDGEWIIVRLGHTPTGKKNIDELNLTQMSGEFAVPAVKYLPETWFHFKKYAGIQGIHLFSKNGPTYPGVKQIKILSPEWEEMVRHATDECQRLGLKFTMQNCPGWSMTGGPWVPVEEAQPEIVESVYRVKGGSKFEAQLTLNQLKKGCNFS